MNTALNEQHRPRVSVIIPVKNGRPFLDEAIESVLCQDYQSFEVILINDGSTDDDYDRFSALDTRIRVFNTPGRGTSTARNIGMSQARGDYFAFLDADDIWYPGKLTAQVRYLEAHSNVWVVFGGFIKWRADPNGNYPPASSLVSNCLNLVGSAPEKSGWLYTRLLDGLLVGMNTAVIRRVVYESVGGFNESMRHGEDYDFWLKASRLAEIHSLAGDVALYRIHGGSAMNHRSSENQLAVLLIASRIRWGLRNPDGTRMPESDFFRRLCEVEFDHGYAHFWGGSRSIARRSFWYCLIRAYRPSRCLFYLFRSFL